MAISGWNIAIVAAAIAALAGRFGRRRRAVVTVVAIVAYICFAGASASVLRAGAMAGVVLLARETGGPAGPLWMGNGAPFCWRIRASSLTLFQLSTLATVGLIALATHHDQARSSPVVSCRAWLSTRAYLTCRSAPAERRLWR